MFLLTLMLNCELDLLGGGEKGHTRQQSITERKLILQKGEKRDNMRFFQIVLIILNSPLSFDVTICWRTSACPKLLYTISRQQYGVCCHGTFITGFSGDFVHPIGNLTKCDEVDQQTILD